MPESTALVILQSVAQNPYTNAAGISMTQYSAIYNNEKKTVEVWPFQNYSKSFKFDVEGNRISVGQWFQDLQTDKFQLEIWKVI